MASADGFGESASTPGGEPGDASSSVPGSRQRVVRVPGARRAKLTPAPGATPEPAPRDEASDPRPAPDASTAGPNDDRLRQDVPPHY